MVNLIFDNFNRDNLSDFIIGYLNVTYSYNKLAYCKLNIFYLVN